MYERMLAEHKRLQSQINSLQKQLSTFPDGKLVCSHNGSRYKWYNSDGHHKKYIPKQERPLAEQLAAKKYISLLIQDLSKELIAINFYLKHYNPDNNQALHLLETVPEYAKLLAPYFTPLSKELSHWANSPYEKNNTFPEQLIHKTVSGNFVRSKSETIIAMTLHTKKIPFRYECILQLGNNTIFPDFTIRHPKTGIFFYWEHFGLVDNEVYRQNMHSKLQLYTSHGIIPSIQLITTYETKKPPLSSELVEKIIEYYFL